MSRPAVRVMGMALLVVSWAGASLRAESRTVARCGAGFLEEVDGYRVLHVKGTPYEMGYQQGALLKDDIRENVRYLFEVNKRWPMYESGTSFHTGISIGPSGSEWYCGRYSRKGSPKRRSRTRSSSSTLSEGCRNTSASMMG